MVITDRAGTLLGPLTTTWSMPSSCSVHVVPCATCDGGFSGQRCVVEEEDKESTGAPSDYTGCWPPALTEAGTPGSPFMGWGFYSPGLACPTGYTAACTAEYGKRPGWELEFTLIPGETAVGCCPEGFKCTNFNGQTCIAVDTKLTVSTALCSGRELVNFGQVTYPVFIDITTTITEATSTGGRGTLAVPTSQEVTLLAPMFQLNYQASDVAKTTAPPTAQASPSSSESSHSPPISSNPVGSDPTSGNPVPAGEQGGLSTGAVVGIGVGAALGGILLGVLAILFFLRKKTGAAEFPESQPAEQPQYDYKYATEMPGWHQPNATELWSQPAELSSGSDRWSHNHHPHPT
ncbi:hypothetical protein CHGG_07444 [Chaetomium globosum CBS 148.51]|uniref:Mid2 domain-containing protein n=1 Tax=Chaetomium globosum (strain ATCC 6205 / CBS 148.51 / DSM 1962 / NBRC 6347 / NRRL 1970) TaxID=306901 RepID=Q2GX60_CHAGB|nr:uncharacterized protein CHGG_07444 [Chaetomium globosum CBS 148.51]EAQ86191.1 hypothetical protein CHGG_07444 [Chaetomium globosum CBS 148.51]